MADRKDSRLTGINPLAYLGVEPVAPVLFFSANRAPTVNDYSNYNIGHLWLDRSSGPTGEIYMLTDKDANVATWRRLGAAEGIETLTGDAGIIVVPDGINNVDVLGGTNITTTGTLNTLTIDLDGNVADTYTTDSGNAMPAAGVLNILGDGVFLATSGAGSTVTIDLADSVATNGQVIIGATGASPGWSTLTAGTGITITNAANSITITSKGANSFVTDSGTATPVAGILNVVGDGVFLATSGAGNTITMDLVDSVATDGQVIIGATGASPGWSTLTAGTGITITNAANSITITATGTDIVQAGDNINIQNLTEVNLNETIHWPDTNAAGTTGVIYLGGSGGTGGTRFMHNYGAGGAVNTFLGERAGNFTLTGSSNTGIGLGVMDELTTGANNTAMGGGAMGASTSAFSNSAFGNASLLANTGGDGNSGFGRESLEKLTGGDNNVAVGYLSLDNVLTGDLNIGVGYQAGTSYTSVESSNIVIGNSGTTGESNIIRIGTNGSGAGQQDTCFIAGIRGVTTGVADAIAVLIDSSHQLGTASSSIRFKQNVVDMGEQSSDITKLRPVIFEYKSHPGIKQYGLIAEEVKKVFPRLVVHDEDGLPETVKYNELPQIMLNEIIKMSKKIAELEDKLDILQK